MASSTGAQYKSVLRKAAKLIKTEGWVQDDYYLPNEGYCVLGAVFTVAQDDAALNGRDPGQAVTWSCLEELEREVRKGSPESIHLSVAAWNDTICQSTDEAIALLMRVGKIHK